MIRIEKISKNYNEKTVFKDYSLDLHSGGIYGIMGPSGCGKTTLVSIIAGLVKVDEGKVQVNGNTSMVFQEDRLLEQLSPLENLNLVQINIDQNTQILCALGLKEDINTPVSKLSGGMKRRVALARALAFDHDILILDEPFKGFDKINLEKAITLIKSLECDKTIILITHSLLEAEKLGCQILNLS